MTRYTAITIGPIIDTLSLTSSPGGTWGASYLFSWLSRELITRLLREGIQREQFAAPYFNLDTSGRVVINGCEDVMVKGVGMFHDHIIFRNRADEESELPCVSSAIQDVIGYLAGKLIRGLSRGLVRSAFTEQELAAWLRRYLRIYAVERDIPDGQGPITAFGPILDALELEPSYLWEEKENPLLTLFESNTSQAYTFGNRLLTGSFLVRGLKEWMPPDPEEPSSVHNRDKERKKEWMLLDPENPSGIRDIESIARGKSEENWKSLNYYCVLCADGDSMGTMYSRLTETEAVQAASFRCIEFCAESARIILEYGGMPLYAGGDDLLAILPVTGKNEQTILGLVQDLNDTFNEAFEKERERFGGAPSLSVGVEIQYVKSPLYEAMERARNLLYEAKTGTTKKNGLRVQLIKHSGQTVTLPVDRMSGDPLLGQMEALIWKARGEAEEFLSSAGYQLEAYHDLFLRVLERYKSWLDKPGTGKDPISVFFQHLFDDEGQKAYQSYLNALAGLCRNVVNGRPDLGLEELAERQAGVVRFLHFMAEEGTT